MNRRNALVALVGTPAVVGLSPRRGRATQAKAAPLPGAVALKLGQPMDLRARSAPVKMGKDDLHIIAIGRGTFQVGPKSRLTAKLHAAVAQYAKVEYWISVGVFDAKGELLGTAGHKEQVEHVRLGRMLTVFREIDLDFGISRAFGRAAFVAVAISEREVPQPG